MFCRWYRSDVNFKHNDWFPGVTLNVPSLLTPWLPQFCPEWLHLRPSLGAGFGSDVWCRAFPRSPTTLFENGGRSLPSQFNHRPEGAVLRLNGCRYPNNSQLLVDCFKSSGVLDEEGALWPDIFTDSLRSSSLLLWDFPLLGKRHIHRSERPDAAHWQTCWGPVCQQLLHQLAF